MRRTWLLIALIFLLARPSLATTTYIRQIGTNTTASGTTVDVTMPLGATLAGSNLIVFSGENNSSTGTLGVGDGSNTYSQVGTYSSVGNTRGAMMITVNAAAVSVITPTWSNISATRVAATVWEIVGGNITSAAAAIDYSTNPSGAGTSLATGAVNTTYASDIIIFAVFNTPCTTVGATCASDSMTGTGGYAYLTGNGLGNRVQSACRATSATGSYTGTMNWASSVNADGMVGAFKAVAGSTATSCTAPSGGAVPKRHPVILTILPPWRLQ